MTSQDIPRLKISSPGEIAELVPYLMGFQPEESLVIMVIQQGTVAVTARTDLADVQSQTNLEQLIGRIWTRFPDAGAVALAYTPDHEAGWDMLSRVDAHLPWQADRTLLLIDGDTWHTPDGKQGGIDQYGRLAAEAALAGLSKLERRSDLAARLASADDTDTLAKQVTEVLDRLPAPGDNRRLVDQFSDLLVAHLPVRVNGKPHHAISTPDAMAMAILSQNPAVRDVALLSMTRETATQHLQLWCNIINRTPAYGSEQPLHLAGMAAWLAGEGALASMALERAEDAVLPGDPPRTAILAHLIDQVVPPSAWDTLRPEALANAHPLVRTAVAKLTPPPATEPWESIEPPAHTTRHTPRDIAPPTPGIAI